MKTRTRNRATDYGEESYADYSQSNLDLEALSDEELEALLFEEETVDKKQGIWNLPTMAGLSMILVGVVYILQELGITTAGFDIRQVVTMLPFMAGILIILVGFGVLSWRPKRRRKVRKGIEVPTGKEKVVVEPTRKGSKKKRRLERSRDNKKIAGVCAGVAEYFSIDPTLVRIAFVIGTIASGGPFLLAYLVLAFIMPKPDPLSLEERITIIRDS